MFKSRWCFTLNNYTETEYEELKSSSESCTTYSVLGKETGESGTPHIQGFLILQKSQRLSFLQRRFSRRAHYEPARGNNVQASDYCKKDGDFWEHGTFATSKGSGSQWVQFRDYCSDRDTRPTDEELVSEFPALFGQYPKGVQRILDVLFPVEYYCEAGALTEWQQDLDSILEGEADGRRIYFYIDKEGGSGKSYYARRYLSTHGDGQYFRLGKRDDLAHTIDSTKRCFFFDIPRGGMEYLQYTILEQLKDGLVYSPKYESVTKVMTERCHVIVFCNEDPDMDKLSKDRFVLKEISQLNIMN